MNALDSAAQSFFAISEVTRLLTVAYQNGCEFEYEIKAGLTPGKDKPQTVHDLPQPTGGYDIRIVIHPPTQPAAEILTHLATSPPETK